MRIGVNTRLFVKGKMDGIAWFSYEILRRMVLAHPDDEFVFFFDRQYDKSFIFGDNVKPVIVNPQARHPFLWILFFEIGIRRALKREKIDVFFSPDGWLCLGTKVKTINVIHDLNFLHYPKFNTYLYSKYYNFFFPKFARKACAIATVSEYSKQDIAENYHISPDKITVTYNGVAEDFYEISSKDKELLREKLTDGIPYFVFVGTANKRKNVANILRAFDNFRAIGHNAKLVFVGMNKYWDDEMKTVLRRMQFRKDVIFTGYISTNELNKVISSSVCLLYPSIFEGFGVPIIEAFACGTPVIASNTTSMPEVAADAALLVNPFSINEIISAMEQVFIDDSLRDNLIYRGKKRIEAFKWENSAEKLWGMIKLC